MSTYAVEDVAFGRELIEVASRESGEALLPRPNPASCLPVFDNFALFTFVTISLPVMVTSLKENEISLIRGGELNWKRCLGYVLEESSK